MTFFSIEESSRMFLQPLTLPMIFHSFHKFFIQRSIERYEILHTISHHINNHILVTIMYYKISTMLWRNKSHSVPVFQQWLWCKLLVALKHIFIHRFIYVNHIYSIDWLSFLVSFTFLSI